MCAGSDGNLISSEETVSALGVRSAQTAGEDPETLPKAEMKPQQEEVARPPASAETRIVWDLGKDQHHTGEGREREPWIPPKLRWSLWALQAQSCHQLLFEEGL